MLPSALTTAPVACYSDGTVGDAQKVSALYGNFNSFYTLRKGDYFGHAAEGLGDIDGDGVGDLAVGAFKDDDGASGAGAIYILLLESSGNVKNALKLSMLYGGISAFYTLKDGDGFGSSIASLGDFDGDGVVDLAVGALWDDDGGTRAGAVYVLFLTTSFDVKGAQKLSMDYGDFSTFYTLDDGDEFGHLVASLGDIDGDGVEDVAVGARTDDDGGNAAGAVYMLLLDSTGNVKDAQKISALYGSFNAFYTLEADTMFGNKVTSLGDFDGDNEVDLAVSSYRDNDGGTQAGAVYLLFLKNDRHVKDARKISVLYGNLDSFYTLEAEDHFGSSVAALGDLDGDGNVDLAVSAYRDDADGSFNNAGALYILFLNADGTVKNARKISMLYGNFNSFYTLDPSDSLGHSIAALGDIDGDGVMDLAVGAFGDDDGGDVSGAMYVISLEKTYCESMPTNAPTPVPSQIPSPEPTLVPTPISSPEPSSVPTPAPTALPLLAPSAIPTLSPSLVPSLGPSLLPSPAPMPVPSSIPSMLPAPAPSPGPSNPPTQNPTVVPSHLPSKGPTLVPTLVPTTKPSSVPSSLPTPTPSPLPSTLPSALPTSVPTIEPSQVPSNPPTHNPTAVPSQLPSKGPTLVPTLVPSIRPSSVPSSLPTPTPSPLPSVLPSALPTSVPTIEPSSSVPSFAPSLTHTPAPSKQPDYTLRSEVKIVSFVCPHMHMLVIVFARMSIVLLSSFSSMPLFKMYAATNTGQTDGCFNRAYVADFCKCPRVRGTSDQTHGALVIQTKWT